MAVKFCLWNFRTNVPLSVFEPPVRGCWRTSCRRVAATAPPKEPWSSFSSPPPSASVQRRSWPSERWRSLSWLRSRGEQQEEYWMVCLLFFFYLSPIWPRDLQISKAYWLLLFHCCSKSILQLTGSQCMIHWRVYEAWRYYSAQNVSLLLQSGFDWTPVCCWGLRLKGSKTQQNIVNLKKLCLYCKCVLKNVTRINLNLLHRC